jgi:uncharacterized membrane protein YtjA (UPF0391 family)
VRQSGIEIVTARGNLQLPLLLIVLDGAPVSISAGGHASAGNPPVLPPRPMEESMLKLALFFLIVSIIAGLFGFTGISAASAGIAKILFVIFIVVFLVLLVVGLVVGSKLF